MELNSIADSLGGRELGDRSNNSIDMPVTPGLIAQEDAARDEWDAAAEAAKNRVTNTWVPDGYELKRNDGGLPICAVQPGYVKRIAHEAPLVMENAIALAHSLLGPKSNHKIAAEEGRQVIVALRQWTETYNMGFAFMRNIAYAFRNAAVYQAVTFTEQADQHQNQVQRAVARGVDVSESESIIRSASFRDQTLLQLYVATQVLLAFDPKDLSGAFNPNWERTAASYCERRATNYTKNVLNRTGENRQSNVQDTFELSSVAKLLAAAAFVQTPESLAQSQVDADKAA